MAKNQNIFICILALLFSFCTPRNGNVAKPSRAADTTVQQVIIYDTVRQTVELTDTTTKVVEQVVQVLVEDTKTKSECLRETFAAEVGVREEGGNNRGSRIKEYLATTNLGEGYAWCAAFVCWSLEQCDIKHPASAWSPTVGLYNTVYRKGENFPTNPDRLVFALYYSNLKRIGHVGFIEKIRDKDCITVEGNTNGAGSREGDGVHRKMRPKYAIYRISKY